MWSITSACVVVLWLFVYTLCRPAATLYCHSSFTSLLDSPAVFYMSVFACLLVLAIIADQRDIAPGYALFGCMLCGGIILILQYVVRVASCGDVPQILDSAGERAGFSFRRNVHLSWTNTVPAAPGGCLNTGIRRCCPVLLSCSLGHCINCPNVP